MTEEEMLELVAEQFRIARTNGSCDPDKCNDCDCYLDDTLREMVYSQSEMQAQFVVGIVGGFIYGLYGKSKREFL